jgi:hypothetical protein
MKKTLLSVALIALTISSSGCFYTKEAMVCDMISDFRYYHGAEVNFQRILEQHGAFIKQYGVDKAQAMLEEHIGMAKTRLKKSEQALEKANDDYESAKRNLEYWDELLLLLREWRKREGI